MKRTVFDQPPARDVLHREVGTGLAPMNQTASFVRYLFGNDRKGSFAIPLPSQQNAKNPLMIGSEQISHHSNRILMSTEAIRRLCGEPTNQRDAVDERN